jgi:malonyl CoA-acyl carrier protein transacylase
VSKVPNGGRWDDNWTSASTNFVNGSRKFTRNFFQVSNASLLFNDELIRPEREEDSRINQTNIAQPTILAIQIALTALWTSWGICPSCVVGHSVGEVTMEKFFN